MRPRILLTLIAQGALVAAFAAGLRGGAFPLGVVGEWEWLRLPRGVGPAPVETVLGVLAIGGHAAFAAMGRRALTRGDRPSCRREVILVAGLWLVAAAVQAIVLAAAPMGYGLEKWALTLQNPASSGYYTVAKRQVRDPGRFVAAYPAWIAGQDSLHIGTHPPGLFLTSHAAIAVMKTRPGLARFLDERAPEPVRRGFRAVESFDPLSRADRAALTGIGALTLALCASTSVPLYLLARIDHPASSAWSAAVLWPLVPAAILFQPAADAAFAFLATTILALAAWALRDRARRGILAATGSGTLLAIGMLFTLAFLAVGLIVAIQAAWKLRASARHLAMVLAATATGFLAPTFAFWAAFGANPFVIWWWNQRHHAEFYDHYPRSYLAWVVANPVELAVALGLPAATWVLLALRRPRAFPAATCATLAVLALLTLGGRNLSEVARLWIPMMPALLVAAGVSQDDFKAGPVATAITVALGGLETLILQTTIQVVYPV